MSKSEPSPDATECLGTQECTDVQEYPSTQEYSNAQEYNVTLPERSLSEVAAIMGISKRMVLYYEERAFKKLKQRLGPRLDYGSFEIKQRRRRKAELC